MALTAEERREINRQNARSGVAGRSRRRQPSAKTRPRVSGGSFPVFFAVPEYIRLPEPGPRFQEGRGRFSPVIGHRKAKGNDDHA
jgi:hypothetical protein